MSRPQPALSALLQRPDLWRGASLAPSPETGLGSGFAALDAVLPGQGWPRGALTEILPQSAGCGELSLLLPALARLEAAAGWIALVAPPWLPHAPAWQAAGVSLSRLLVVRAAEGDAAWASEQLLGSGQLAALLAWLPRADARGLRRLQLAASGRRSLAFVFRPTSAANGASPAPLRLLLAAGERSLTVRLLKRRGPPLSGPLALPVGRPLPWARLGQPSGAQAPEDQPVLA